MNLYTYNKNVIYQRDDNYYILFTRQPLENINKKKIKGFNTKKYLEDRIKLAHTIYNFIPSDILCAFIRGHYGVEDDRCVQFETFLLILSNYHKLEKNINFQPIKPELQVGVEGAKEIFDTLDYLNTTLIFQELVVSFLQMDIDNNDIKKETLGYIEFVKDLHEPRKVYLDYLQENVNVYIPEESKYNILEIHKKMFAEDCIKNAKNIIIVNNIQLLTYTKNTKNHYYMQKNFLIKKIQQLLNTAKKQYDTNMCFDITYETTTTLNIQDVMNILYPILIEAFGVQKDNVFQLNIMVKKSDANNLTLKFNGG